MPVSSNFFYDLIFQKNILYQAHLILLVPFSFGKSTVLSAPTAPYSHVAYGKPPFCCQTSAAGCASRRRPAAPASPLPASCQDEWLVLLHTIASNRNLCLFLNLGIHVQDSV